MSRNSTLLPTFAYYAARCFMYPIKFLPYRAIHALGSFWGNLAYFCAPKKIKKITYNNLALAKRLKLNEKEMKRIARQSFQNLAINTLEYFKLKDSQKKMDRFVTGKNIQPFHDLLNAKQGAIAVTGHIANWELCFLHHTQILPAYAVGKPIKNKKLYNYILSIRQMHGGKIIEMQNAISQGVKVLKEGAAFSMVNDQSFTSSSYSYPFLGVRAWTSPSPAFLAYRANAPILPVTTTRLPKGKYEYEIHPPIWPNRKNPIKKEIPLLMDKLMAVLESHVAKHPEQWLWQHKRWKQEGFRRVYKQYKADSILFILPTDPLLFHQINEGLPVLFQIYRRSFLTFFVPKKFKNEFKLKKYECHYYKNEEDLFVRDYRYQLVFDLSNHPKIKKHFLKLGAHSVYSLDHLLAAPGSPGRDDFNMRELLIRVLCLPGTPFY